MATRKSNGPVGSWESRFLALSEWGDPRLEPGDLDPPPRPAAQQRRVVAYWDSGGALSPPRYNYPLMAAAPFSEPLASAAPRTVAACEGQGAPDARVARVKRREATILAAWTDDVIMMLGQQWPELLPVAPIPLAPSERNRARLDQRRKRLSFCPDLRRLPERRLWVGVGWCWVSSSPAPRLRRPARTTPRASLVDKINARWQVETAADDKLSDRDQLAKTLGAPREAVQQALDEIGRRRGRPKNSAI